MLKALLGYDIAPGMSVEEYERWLREIHIPDLLANPHLSRLVFNSVIGPVTRASGGSASVDSGQTFYRIAELHFEDLAAYERYQAWFQAHPIPKERGPAGRTAFRFYVLADSVEVTRDLAVVPDLTPGATASGQES